MDFQKGETHVQAFVVLGLLLVYYAEAEVDFVGLVETRRHAHDLRERLFRMLKRAITIVQNANTVPKLGFLEVAVSGDRVTGYEIPTFGSVKWYSACW